MAAATSNNPSQIIHASEGEWESLSATIKFKKLWSDPASKRRAQLTRFEPGAVLPMHRHVGDELVYVIEGSISDGSVLTAGNVGYRPYGCVHTVTSKAGATVLAIITGDIEPAVEIGDSPRSRIFVPSDVAWTDTMPGMRQKPIWHDEETKRRFVLARFAPGAQIPIHRHVGDELVFLLEGSTADESGEVMTGELSYRPDGCVHNVTSRHGATALAFITGGIEML